MPSQGKTDGARTELLLQVEALSRLAESAPWQHMYGKWEMITPRTHLVPFRSVGDATRREVWWTDFVRDPRKQRLAR